MKTFPLKRMQFLIEKKNHDLEYPSQLHVDLSVYLRFVGR